MKSFMNGFFRILFSLKVNTTIEYENKKKIKYAASQREREIIRLVG